VGEERMRIKARGYPLRLKVLAKKILKLNKKEDILEILEIAYDLGKGRKENAN
jgi:hypothetical protein